MKKFILILKENGNCMNPNFSELSKFNFKGEIRDDLTSEYEKNITHFSKKIQGVLLPQNREDVEAVVKWARNFKVSLYPLSQGNNWGFGSKLPVQDQAVVLDLSKINKIRSINVEHGYAVIEAGVTQLELSNKLKELNAPFTLDVTGSGAHTSVIGNALERGIAYHTLRVDQVYNFEVLLGNGTWLTTGYHFSENAEIKHLYPHGIGPGLHHLFFQSNFGIITAATVKLQPSYEDSVDFKFSISDQNLGHAFEQLKTLRRRGMLNSICRTGDFSRSFETLAPLLYEEYQKIGKDLTCEELQESYRKFNKSEWTSFGRLTGTKDDVAYKKSQVEKCLKPYGELQFFTEKSIEKLYKFTKFFHQWDLYCNLKASESLRKLTAGIPTSDALKMVHWDNRESKTMKSVMTERQSLEKAIEKPFDKSIDHSEQGFILVVPLVPLTSKNVEKLVHVTRTVAKLYDISLGITLNIISAEVIEGVISIKFSDSTQGHQCMKHLYSEYEKLQFYPYRLNPEIMSSYIDKENTFWSTAALIKKSLDPDHIIAPGRYSEVE